MPFFNPNVPIIEYITGETAKFGAVEDPIARGAIRKIRERLAAFQHEFKDCDTSAIEEELAEAIKAAQPMLTVGRAILLASTSALPDPDNDRRNEELTPEAKADLESIGFRLFEARTKGGVDATVSLTHVEVETLKDRVSRMWPGPLVLGQVLRAIKPDPIPEPAT